MRVPWEPSSCAACRCLRSKFRSHTGVFAATRFAWMGTGRKGRSSAWSPSWGVTSKSPMDAGVASFLDPHARVARRARQRRRCYQSGKGSATDRAGPGRRQVHRWPVWSARNRPRPAPRQRPGPAYGLILLGDPPSFDEDDSDPHCCVKPLDAVALPSLAATAACRSRHGPPASCSAPMGSRSRCLLTVRPGMPPRPPPLPRSPRQSRLRCRTSAVSLRAPRTFQKSREAAACRVRCPLRPRSGAWRIRSIRPRRPSIERHGASVPMRLHLPPQLRHIRVSRNCDSALGRRHPRAMAAVPAPDFHRPAGLPVCRDGSRQRRHRAAPTWPLQ